MSEQSDSTTPPPQQTAAFPQLRPRREYARGERVVAVALLAVGVATWIYRARFARFDTDEAQHLHVVWGWAHGMLPYRDFFDNHVPLFHVLCVPFYLLMGDRADLLIWARMAMLPIFLLCLLCAWMTARAVFGQRAALWTAVGVCLWPQFLDCTAQFRTDDLWRYCFWRRSRRP